MKFPLIKLNQVILIFIIGDFIFTIAGGIIAPIFSIFVLQGITGSALTVIGFAAALYWIVKSVLQLPIARYLDKNHGEIDDYYSILIGTCINAMALVGYYFAHHVWQVYVFQMMIGVGDAFVVPPYLAIFTRHVDKDSEGFEWALRSSFSVGLGSALAGALSGVLASIIGIRPLFLIDALFTLVGLFVLTFLRPYLKPRVPKEVDRALARENRI